MRRYPYLFSEKIWSQVWEEYIFGNDKKLIDDIHLWHTRKPVNYYTMSIKSIHYHDSIVVIEKGVVKRPMDVKKGDPIIKDPYVNYYMQPR